MSYEKPSTFQINVPDSLLELTKQKLRNARLPDQLKDVVWEGNPLIHRAYIDGTPVNEIERLVDHWLNNYDWRVHEAQLNTLPQFTLPIQVDGFDILTIHFVHQRSTSPDAIPLLFIHGWPGHFQEVSKILPLLTNPPAGEQPFHVVAPSIPGFGFSTNPSVKGYNLSKMAETFNKLMISLGYAKYVAQGGDWGSSISRMLGIKYPETCRAVHVNLLRGVDPPKWYRNPWIWFKMHSQLVHYSKEEEYMIARSQWFLKGETGYRVFVLPLIQLIVGHPSHETTDSVVWTVGFTCWIISLDMREAAYVDR